MSSEDHIETLRAELNTETAKMEWRELQRFFASGVVIWVDAKEDLIDTAIKVATDNKSAVEALLEQKRIAQVSDDQARTWFANSAELWAVVVKPWVLVQDRD